MSPDRLGVLGWPVGHSRSPAMHNAALRHVGLDGWRYQLLPVPPEVLAETVRALPGAGLRGANVTIPHKEQALAVADTATARARAIGAVNTLLFDREGHIHGDNTDGLGLAAALPDAVSGGTALVLGAGGTARAAVWALQEAGAREVRVWNRSAERARALCAELGGRPVAGAEPADVLVQCTSVGLGHHDGRGDLPLGDDLSAYGCVIDVVYGASPTALARAARSAGVPVVEGLDLLVAQGALAFELFTGMAAPIEVMRAAAAGGYRGERDRH